MNQNPYQPVNTQPLLILPNSTAALVLGIISIASLCCCSIVGFIVGIIGLVLGINAVALYRQSPGVYTEASYQNANAGKICSIIGLVLSVLSNLLIIIFRATYIAVIKEIIESYSLY